MASRTITSAEAAEAVRRTEAAYLKALDEERRVSGLEALRNSLPGLDEAVVEHKARLAELEARLAGLQATRDGFAKELAGLPSDTSKVTAQEEDRIRYRRSDLRAAIDALDGASARGTLVDHLGNGPRIPGTRNRIEEARDLLAKAERTVDDARRQLSGN
jgi:chromosome segregation ATPase